MLATFIGEGLRDRLIPSPTPNSNEKTPLAAADCGPALLASRAPVRITEQKYEALAADKSLSDTDRLHKLFDLDWDRGLHESPEFATSVGYPGLDGLLDGHMTQEATYDQRKAEQDWPARRDQLVIVTARNYNEG